MTELDLPGVRRAFPFLEGNTYLNTAAAGLSWSGQGAASAAFYEAVKSTGMQGAPEWRSKAAQAKASLARLLGVAPHSIHFVGSTTEGMNLVALSLPLRPGDQVAIAEDEFPSVAHAWENLRSRGIEVIRVPIPSEAQRTDALLNAVTPRIRAVAVSHIHWRSGTRVALERLSARCREMNCWLIADGVQAVGAVPVQAGLADAYCASVFKWLLSGFGLGFVVLGERLAGALSPAIRGYNNEPPSRELGYGHVNYPGIYALEATLQYLESVGWSAIHAQVDRLALKTFELLRLRGFEILTPRGAHGGIVSARHPEASRLVRALASKSVFVEDREALIRISPHFYNSDHDLDRLGELLAAPLQAISPID